ncbi:anti-sigma-factor antagonist [Magnetococcus marinus MC-1]|uniref:Anti-sigma-factor antagonist n=1 Tax=Magnetococcus marinus (strain ATCC BAA-1437 / JCM 17883 / MC-1) TaxID=156889 RepID=A0LCA0_MAGMM|nr:STAS domain-containing protein [Magnetococcus marinus]ABK45593.1 anti-sigma-factor antagonist [Magnetococcus marinus MC-1]
METLRSCQYFNIYLSEHDVEIIPHQAPSFATSSYYLILAQQVPQDLHVIFNCSTFDHIDSGGLGTLILFHNNLAHLNQPVTLREIHPKVMKKLKTAHLQQLFHLEELP